MTSPISCPGCDGPMERENFASAFVELCVDGCFGMWFDGGELAKLDSAKKGMGPALERVLQ